MPRRSCTASARAATGVAFRSGPAQLPPLTPRRFLSAPARVEMGAADVGSDSSGAAFTFRARAGNLVSASSGGRTTDTSSVATQTDVVAVAHNSWSVGDASKFAVALALARGGESEAHTRITAPALGRDDPPPAVLRSAVHRAIHLVRTLSRNKTRAVEPNCSPGVQSLLARGKAMPLRGSGSSE